MTLRLARQDVEATGIEWLIVKYKQYILLREHLLREIPTFRTNVGSNVSSPPAASFENGIPRAGQAPGLSASGAAATKVQAAREYRQRKGRLAAAGDGKRGAGAGAETQEPRELPVPGVETDQRVSGALQVGTLPPRTLPPPPGGTA